MARHQKKPCATEERFLEPASRTCFECGKGMWIAYHNRRRLVTLQGVLEVIVPVRKCPHPQCRAYKRPVRPWEEGALALPQAEYGLDVIALVGNCRYRDHRSVPEIHRLLTERGVPVCERTVTNLLARYEELLALKLSDHTRLQNLLQKQGKVVLAFDGMQPDVGHEVLWVFRDLLSGEIVLAKSLLSATQEDITALLRQIHQALPVPILGVVTDGQTSLRNADAQALPGVPHPLCQYHYHKEAAKPLYEADRHAKKELKKQVRGVRAMERQITGRTDPEALAAQGYCQAIRSALTDDGRPPLSAPGLRLRRRLQAVATSLARVQAKGVASPS
jgi:hypothetical protein